MRLLSEGSQVLVFGGRSGGVIVGVGLVLAGLAFGVLPLFLYLRNREIPFLILSGFGLLLLLAGLWALGHQHRIELDGTSDVVRVMRGNRFLSSPDSIPFSQVAEVGILQKVYTSVSAGVARQYYVMELRLADGSRMEIQDQEVEQDLEETRRRGRQVAEIVGVPFDGEPSPPP